jgi:hypothetical protein
MKIEIDGNEIVLFQGAQLKDALLKVSKKTLNAVKDNNLKVIDEWGNSMGLDGQLADGQILHLKTKNNQSEIK